MGKSYSDNCFTHCSGRGISANRYYHCPDIICCDPDILESPGQPWAILGAADQISDLKVRQLHLREVIESMEEEPLPLITSSMERLTELIEKAEPVLEEALQANKTRT